MQRSDSGHQFRARRSPGATFPQVCRTGWLRPSGDGPLEYLAERLFRAVGNSQGRHRLGGDGRLRVPPAPRALVLGTGEAVPPGQSIRARLLIVEVSAGEVERTALSACQRAGQEGLLAAAMGAFVVWLAGRYEEMQERSHRRVLEIRSQGHGGAGHARTPAAVAELQSGMEIFLEFAAAVGAIGGAEKEELEGRNGRALGELAGRQAKYQAARDPALRFMALLPSRAGGRNGACGRPAGQSAGRGGRLGMAAPQDRPKMGVAGHAHRLGGGERLISGSAGELPDGPGTGWGGTHTGERAGALPLATEVRPLGQPGRRPRNAAGTPDIGRSPATSAAPESQRLARVVTRVSGRRSHRWATQRKRRHLSDLSDVPPVGSLSRSYAVQLWNAQD